MVIGTSLAQFHCELRRVTAIAVARLRSHRCRTACYAKPGGFQHRPRTSLRQRIAGAPRVNGHRSPAPGHNSPGLARHRSRVPVATPLAMPVPTHWLAPACWKCPQGLPHRWRRRWSVLRRRVFPGRWFRPRAAVPVRARLVRSWQYRVQERAGRRRGYSGFEPIADDSVRTVHDRQLRATHAVAPASRLSDFRGKPSGRRRAKMPARRRRMHALPCAAGVDRHYRPTHRRRVSNRLQSRRCRVCRLARLLRLAGARVLLLQSRLGLAAQTLQATRPVQQPALALPAAMPATPRRQRLQRPLRFPSGACDATASSCS